MRIALVGLGSLLLLVLRVVVTGSLLPEAHVATRERALAADPATVFAVIATPADCPDGRSAPTARSPTCSTRRCPTSGS